MGETRQKPAIAANRVARVLHGSPAMPAGHNLPAQRPPSKPAPETPAQQADRASFDVGMRSMLHEWAALSERMTGMLKAIGQGALPAEENRAAAPAAVEKHYTPLTGKALKSTVELISYRPEIRRGKLYFSCPACQHQTAVFKFYTATATRCPKCYSAIRTPDLKRSGKAFNLERDIVAFLHPDRYEAVLPRRRTIGTVVPLPKLNTAFVSGGVALIMGLCMMSLRMANAKASGDPVQGIAKVEIDQDTVDLPGRATDVVEAYLEAKGAVRKSAYVKDGARVARLMSRAFKDDPSMETRGYRSVSCDSTGLSPATGSNHFVSRVSAQLGAGRVEHFVVEHLPMGDVIEWEASTGYNPHGWENVARRATETQTEIAQMRVLARPDNYYNYGFEDEQQHLCLRLENPRNHELMGYGYVTWEEAEQLGLLDALQGATSTTPERLTLDLAFAPNTGKTRQVQIIGMPQHGWRAPAGTMLATTGTGEPE